MRCPHKKHYQSKIAALLSGSRALSRQGQDSPKLRAYYCRNCYSWHLTSKEKEVDSPSSSV